MRESKCKDCPYDAVNEETCYALCERNGNNLKEYSENSGDDKMSENEYKKYGEEWRAELMKWRKSELIDFLQETLICNRIHKWHYPSKGELPEHEKDILGYWIGAGFCVGWYNEKQDLWLKNPLHSEWLMQPDAWQYLPEPPKETKC